MPKTKTKSNRVKKSRFGALKAGRLRVFGVALLFGLVGMWFVVRSSAQNADGSVPIYAVTNKQTGKLLLTNNKDEAGNAWSKLGFVDRGVKFYAWNSADGNRKPVYRISYSGGGWLFTISTAERDALLSNPGFKSEGIAFYAFETKGSGRLPVYRLFHTSKGHYFTVSTSERDSLKAQGFSDEGTPYYVSSNPAPTNKSIPSGSVEQTLKCVSIRGGTVDKDSPGKPNEAHIYIDGTGYVVKATTTKNSSGEYKFSLPMPDRWKDSKQHTATVYAINVDSTGFVTGTNKAIGTVSFACDSSGKAVATAPATPASGAQGNSYTCLGEKGPYPCSKADYDKNVAFLAFASSDPGAATAFIKAVTESPRASAPVPASSSSSPSGGAPKDHTCLGGNGPYACNKAEYDANQAFLIAVGLQAQNQQNAQALGASWARGWSPGASTPTKKQCTLWFYLPNRYTPGNYFKGVAKGSIYKDECYRFNNYQTGFEGYPGKVFYVNHIDWGVGSEKEEIWTRR